MKYLLKFKFEALKVTKSGSIKGSNGDAECEIETHFNLEELQNKKEDLMQLAKYSLMSNNKMKHWNISKIEIENLSFI